jgi:hypothetical protein
LEEKVNEIVSITDFGASGDYNPDKKTGTDNRNALLSALALSRDIHIPSGRYLFTGWPTLHQVIDATCYGPGQLYYDNGQTTEVIGSVLRAGVCDPDGNLGTLTQGGIVIGGEGPGVHGSLLHAQQNAWPVLEPTRPGSALEFQLYTHAHIGGAKRVKGTGYIDATYGDFRSKDIDAGDLLGFGDRIFRIAAKHSPHRLELVHVDGSPIVFVDEALLVYRHSYYYGDGVCKCEGKIVTRISGDYFFNAAVLSDQKSIYLGENRHHIDRVEDTNTLVLSEDAGHNVSLPFTLKMLPMSKEVSGLRIQGLAGGSEENFSIFETIDGVVRMRAESRGIGAYRPIVMATGRDKDLGRHFDHLVISKEGQIGLGKNYAHPDIGFPTAAKLHVWRDGVQSERPNGDHDVRLAVLETNHGGMAPRQVHIGSFNNFHAGYIQGYADLDGKSPGPIALNPKGGPVAVNTGTDSTITNALEVNGTVAPHKDGQMPLGGPSHRWSAIHAIAGVIQTSDAGEKQDITSVPDELLDAFLDVEPRVFRWRSSVAAKGDEARHHLGYVAQEVASALRARGLDPDCYGFWCSDEILEPVDSTTEGQRLQPSGKFRQALRYEQLLALIDAANRRRYTKLEARLHILEQNL